MVSSEQEQGEPVTYDEVVDALMPRLRPGVSKEDFLASLRHATRTGGHIPGGTAPDISMGPVITDLSGKGVRPEILKALSGGADSPEEVQTALADAIYQQETRRSELHARADHPELFPADPFSPKAAPAIATGEMWHDLVNAGIPAEHVDAILGHMMAAFTAMQSGNVLADAHAVIGRLLAALGQEGA